MKRTHDSVERSVAAVKPRALRVSAPDIACPPGIEEQTSYRWKKRYGGLEVSEVRERKQLREEDLKRMAADLGLDRIMLQGPTPKTGRRISVPLPVFRLLRFLPDTRDAEGHAGRGS